MSGTLALPTTSTFSGLTEQGYINTALAALATLYASASAPTTATTGLASLAYFGWHDTTTNTLKVRDHTDSFWIIIGKFDETNGVWVPMWGGPEQTIASATTCDLGSKIEQVLEITGTTTITGFGSSASVNSPLYFLRFGGALTLTYNATSLILPGAANIVTAAGDTAIAKYEGSGNWRVMFYWPAGAAPVVTPYLEASNGSNVGIVNNTWTKIALGTVALDNRGWWDAVNTRYKPQLAGKYLVICSGNIVPGNSNVMENAGVAVYKNGVGVNQPAMGWNGVNALANAVPITATAIVSLNGSTDYVELYAFSTDSDGSNGFINGPVMLVEYIGP